jgi:hypothetical protein
VGFAVKVNHIFFRRHGFSECSHFFATPVISEKAEPLNTNLMQIVHLQLRYCIIFLQRKMKNKKFLNRNKYNMSAIILAINKDVNLSSSLEESELSVEFLRYLEASRFYYCVKFHMLLQM